MAVQSGSPWLAVPWPSDEETRYLMSPITSAKNYCFPAPYGLVLHSYVLEASYSSVIMAKQVEIEWYGKFIVDMFHRQYTASFSN